MHGTLIGPVFLRSKVPLYITTLHGTCIHNLLMPTFVASFAMPTLRDIGVLSISYSQLVTKHNQTLAIFWGFENCVVSCKSCVDYLQWSGFTGIIKKAKVNVYCNYTHGSEYTKTCTLSHKHDYIDIQYIPRNMHTVLLCFALLWLCNRS